MKKKIKKRVSKKRKKRKVKPINLNKKTKSGTA